MGWSKMKSQERDGLIFATVIVSAMALALFLSLAVYPKPVWLSFTVLAAIFFIPSISAAFWLLSRRYNP
jgi:hypothetical protein